LFVTPKTPSVCSDKDVLWLLAVEKLFLWMYNKNSQAPPQVENTLHTLIRCKLDGKQGGLDMYPAGLSLTFSLRFQPGNSVRARSSTSRHSNGYFPHQGTGKMATWLSLGDLWKWTKISVYLAATTLFVIERVT
jgi:hypothetical protein